MGGQYLIFQNLLKKFLTSSENSMQNIFAIWTLTVRDQYGEFLHQRLRAYKRLCNVNAAFGLECSDCKISPCEKKLAQAKNLLLASRLLSEIYCEFFISEVKSDLLFGIQARDISIWTGKRKKARLRKQKHARKNKLLMWPQPMMLENFWNSLFNFFQHVTTVLLASKPSNNSNFSSSFSHHRILQHCSKCIKYFIFLPTFNAS